MLSRHFYEISEVCVSLIQSLRKGLIDESVFWARELILSCEYELLQKTVLQGWILWLGARNVHWLELWVKCDTNVEQMVLLAEFCILRGKMSKKDKKICLYPFILCAHGSGAELNESNITMGLDTFNPFLLYYNLGAGYTASPTAAIEYVSGLVESVIDPILTAVQSVKNIKLKTLLLAVSCQVACLRTYPADIVITQTDYVTGILMAWDTLINRRKGRLFAIIEKDMLYGKRRVTQDKALFIGQKEICNNGCNYWKQYIDCDDTDALFPDDIPDEWSYEDRSVSHPRKFAPFTVYVKSDYKFKQLWGFRPFIKSSWIPLINDLWTACGCPSI